MDQALFRVVQKATQDLQSLVAAFATHAIVGQCATILIQDPELAVCRYHLKSPYKQCFFLLGLMLGTPEPAKPRRLGHNTWTRACRLLERIYDQYALMYFPQSGELHSESEPWYKHRRVAMPVFLHYFNTGYRLASSEQLSERSVTLLTPFDAELQDQVGISASDALRIARWITATLQRDLDAAQEAAVVARQTRETFLERAERQRWDLARMKQEIQTDACLLANLEMYERGSNLFKVRFDGVVQEFGPELASAFWGLFVSRRGEATPFMYLTETNPAERKPLFLVEPGVVLCPIANPLYNAILDQLSDALLNSPARDAFLRRRDKALEQQAERTLREFFDATARFYSTVFEEPNKQYEHDLIIVWDRKLFIIEAKASPPGEPFRDPDRAFVRIERDFRSDGGIQKAYDQANRLSSRLRSQETVQLFDSTGNHVLTIEHGEIDKVYCVCLTADDFGVLATDLSLLLSKEESADYPWATNILDLETFIDGLTHRGWGPEKLCEYLDARRHLHGRVFTVDELEIAGIFLREGTLKPLMNAPGDMIVLGPDTSKVFDDLYIEGRGGPKVDLSGGEQLKFFDYCAGPLDATMGARVANKASPVRSTKVGRNQSCPCGSGLKYKRCCGGD